MNQRIKQQFDFIIEVDQLKNVMRQSYIADGSRRENDSEHSWHLALMAVILSEHANDAIDVLKVIKMVLIHDLVEIDAGDTFAYDDKGHEDKLDREIKAAERIFNILPNNQARELRELWDEFEDRETKEAKFAAALDRVQPILLNYLSGGKTWVKHGISRTQVINRNQHTDQGSKAVWEHISDVIEQAVKESYLLDE